MAVDKKHSLSDDGKFRPKKIYFAQVSNVALRDDKLSLKAKGLYALIASWITMPDYTLRKFALMNQCTERERAFQSAWDELKEHGYLKQYRKRMKELNKFEYEYELLDEPDLTTPSLINIRIDGTISENNHAQEDNENDSDTSVPIPESVPVPDPTPAAPSPSSPEEHNNKSDSVNREEYAQIVKENIAYDILKTDDKVNIYLDDLFNTMLDVICSKKPTVRINKEEISQEHAKGWFLSLNDEHIRYICDSLFKTSTEISVAPNYLITALYNSKKTINTYYQQMANHDLNENNVKLQE